MRNIRQVRRVMSSGASAVNRAFDKLAQGTYGGNAERLTWEYYDVATMPTAAAVLNMFQVPQGQGSKTIADTNMTTPGTIPQGQHFKVTHIKVVYESNAGISTTAVYNAFNAVVCNTILQLKINNKAPMIEIPLSQVLGMSVASSALAAAGAPTQFGLMTPHGYKLETPVILAALTPFTVALNFATAPGAGLTNDKIHVYLAGTLARSL